MIEFRHLRYFVAVAEEMHFGRAAERLHMAQSPLSHQIRQLERRLGVVLLERDHHVVGLTDAGTAFLEEARCLLADLDRAVDRAQRAGHGEVGRICVGYVPEMSAGVLPESLRTHRQRFPEVVIDLHQGITGDLLERLQAGDLDVAFVRSPGALEHLEYEELVSEELYVARPEGSQPGDQPVDLSGLSGETILVPGPQSAHGLRRDIDAACASAGMVVRSRREASSPTAMLLLVAAGAGVALVPASVARSFPIPGVRFAPAATAPTTSAGMCWRRSDRSQVVGNFLDTTRGLVPGRHPARPAVGPAPAG
ncbi:MAG TPA: LysR substrate-binding domain-containing protein [Acidimicrobiales bacterium]|nr:LysR substrate-binding domain-containing protein [Acidimicrobiales bacterium]